MERPPSSVARRRLLKGAAALPAVLLAGSAGPAFAGRVEAQQRPDADWVPAAPGNYTVANRPRQYPVDFVVIHVTQETYADTLGIFQNPAKKVSAHYVVRSADGRVAQCVREADVGWHAGNWDYNTRSVGIEHEGWVDKPEYFTDAMYSASAALTAAICDSYAIPRTRAHIIGHHEVPGATHTDPGPLWDWDRYIKLVKAA
ncbi:MULTISPECIES: N-acetylmuramoyl-L-alanine amidase [Streptomyces]|uniref:N-acetylmuramoyl-L-alanine amidase n=1 Tax=Streptomyces odorifer TaxID=53450 RepID=A0A7Y6C4E6_9ACTN|nr:MULTISPECIES: peptidoglycan recognition family protein [Streptomyces]NUV35583.1 N-acetylmuramoyl-L-alanine amidase [Streptomyces sp. KAI-27]NUV46785.1 N-acetylmuramoyl-L-alanine amidase [Streptomyces sp. CAI-78]MBL0776176.1 N-acetylmuramoyl-L-alanine amidase [Streptomyces albidoflavus]MBL0801590.1 N-acetylmuramoyl-L-alanine amidase [Streptomyces albidoflavus]MBV1954859.1 N-acetylmuramoyl-L-alanine amidase [Streptomyces sp. BV333]